MFLNTCWPRHGAAQFCWLLVRQLWHWVRKPCKRRWKFSNDNLRLPQVPREGLNCNSCCINKVLYGIFYHCWVISLIITTYTIHASLSSVWSDLNNSCVCVSAETFVVRVTAPCSWAALLTRFTGSKMPLQYVTKILKHIMSGWVGSNTPRWHISTMDLLLIWQ